MTKSSARISRLPSNVEHLVLTVNSFTGQTFKDVDNAFCRVVDQQGKELARYKLAEQGSHTAVVIASLRRSGGSGISLHTETSPVAAPLTT